MRIEKIGNATLYLGSMEDTITKVNNINHVLTDPPYLYLDEKFDKEFDEKLLFSSLQNMLPDNGLITLFGRGTSFYRWNTLLAEMGFKFKEELIWNKRYLSNPCGVLSRIHETISIHTKKNGLIHRIKLPYSEQKEFDAMAVENDIKRIMSFIKRGNGLSSVQDYLETNNIYCNAKKYRKQKHSISAGRTLQDASHNIRTLSTIMNGVNEKSIIVIPRKHYAMEHPTQKPIRLAERILALISDPGEIIYDPFMGSGSFGIACINTDRRYIGSEINSEYFDIACKRIKEAVGLFC